MNDVTVLVVEDSLDLCFILVTLLEAQGYRVITASNGYEAVRLARRARPQVIVTDLALPGIDGWEVLEQIRADPALEHVPVIAMTAYALNALGSLARQDGFARILSKPFDHTMLLHEVASLATPMHSQQPRVAFA